MALWLLTNMQIGTYFTYDIQKASFKPFIKVKTYMHVKTG